MKHARGQQSVPGVFAEHPESCWHGSPHTLPCCAFLSALLCAAEQRAAARDSSESEFPERCPALGEPKPLSRSGNIQVLCPFGQQTRPNTGLSCREGSAALPKHLLAAAEFKFRMMHVEGKSRYRNLLPLEKLSSSALAALPGTVCTAL